MKRDFWDLYSILKSGISLDDACRAYVQRFGVAETDLYHVVTALTWFEDAEADALPPIGMTPKLWSSIRAFFESVAPEIVLPSGRKRATAATTVRTKKGSVRSPRRPKPK